MGGYVLTAEQQRNEMREGDMCADHMRQIGGMSYGGICADCRITETDRKYVM